LLDRLDISLGVDVGANVGQYAESLRDMGYHEQIVSFEVNPDAAALLRQAAAGDATWRVEGYALGALPGSSELHLTVDSMSTSLLKPGSFPRLHPITFWRGFPDPESHEIVQMHGLFVRHGT
jgi:FkbM family methyltransferase